MKAGTCARDRRALQQLDLNVHIKHSDLTCMRIYQCFERLIPICFKPTSKMKLPSHGVKCIILLSSRSLVINNN